MRSLLTALSLVACADPSHAPLGGSESSAASTSVGTAGSNASTDASGPSSDGGSTTTGAAESSSSSGEVEPPPTAGCLEGLPSADGAHIAAIEALAAGEWLELGAPAPDADWGLAMGRSWAGEMAFAPGLRGAFLYGEGVHGFIKPDGHYMDDLWFYDLAAHRWICCHPGAHVDTLSLTIDDEGFEIDADGMRIPVAPQVHAYQLNTYDTDRNVLFMWTTPGVYWQKAIPQRLEWLQPPPVDASPFMFEVATARFDRVRTGEPYPDGAGNPANRDFSTLVYVSTRQSVFFYNNAYPQEVWYYEPDDRRWSRGTDDTTRPPFGIDATSCYDETRDRIYLGGGSYPVTPAGENPLWYYDVALDRFVDPAPSGTGIPSNSFNNAHATMICDPVSDKVLVIKHSYTPGESGDEVGIYVYDPELNAWEPDVVPIPDALGMAPQLAKSAFQDPSLDAIFLYAAWDSMDADATMWVYRHGDPN